MAKETNEIDEGTDYVGYQEAFQLICDNVKTVGVEELPMALSVGRIAAADIVAAVSYPSVDVTLKDGYAVVSADVAKASVQNPVRLKITGSVYAGGRRDLKVMPGSTVKVCSGAPIPPGAEAVVSEELCEEISSDEVLVKADAAIGRNVLIAGGEVKAGSIIVKKGGRLLPGYLGLAAAAGINRVDVYRRPVTAIIGVGDEVVAPGANISPGQLYASNLVTMEAWLESFGISSVSSIARDNKAAIKKELTKHIGDADVILTSGGAWGSERDLVIGVLDELGWRKIFNHVRLGPGKGIAFGIWEGKPVFCLPGGPASNEMAFIQLALPGILRMCGDTRHPLPSVNARLGESVKGRHPAWTEFKDAVLSRDAKGDYHVRLYKHRSRLQAIASANGLLCVPEGISSLSAGEIVSVQVLIPLD
ncbi:MAG: molybdopterin molybdotransferase MoeA [Dehalococcoidales bacterium]|nr:molybdopterin molybdotransferase MoeA [Dehalococcoidales bacterium]